MPYVSPNPGHGGTMVVAVKKHPTKCMAYVAFVTAQKAQAVLGSPPSSICGVPVLPARQHATDPNSIVLKWSDGASIQEQDLAEAIDSMFVGPDREVSADVGIPDASMLGAPAMKAPTQVVLRPYVSAGGGAVRKVARHPTKPVAFVAFTSPDLAQLVLAHSSAPRKIGQVAVDTPSPHRTEPDTLVLFWRQGQGAELSELEVVEHFEQIAASLSGAGPPPETGSPGWGKGGGGHSSPSSSTGSRQFVAGVKKHPTKSMAFVTFQLEEVTQAALMEASTLKMIGQVPLDPLVPHKEDPRSVVMYFKAPGHALSADDIADFFEAFMADLFGFGGGSGDYQQGLNQQHPHQQGCKGGATMASSDPSAWGKGGGGSGGWGEGGQFSQEGYAGGLDPTMPLVMGVKKHPQKTMAYVSFQSPDLAMAALQDPDAPRNIGAATIEPPRPHNTDPCSIVLLWHGGPGPQLSADEIASHYEMRLSMLLGLGGMSAQQQQPNFEEMKLAIGMQPNQPFVVRVKTSAPKKTAFVTFHLPDIAQAIMQDPGAIRAIGNVRIDPLEMHRTDPCTVVLWWKNVPQLDHQVIGEFFEAHVAELLCASMAYQTQPPVQRPAPTPRGGKGGAWVQPVGAAMPALPASSGPPPGQTFTTPEGLSVRKHGSQPMAYVILPSVELAQALLADPPVAVGGVQLLPARPHNTNPKAIVIRWVGGNDLPESGIAAGIAELIAPLMEAAAGPAAEAAEAEGSLWAGGLLPEGDLGAEDGQEVSRKRPGAEVERGLPIGASTSKRFKEH